MKCDKCGKEIKLSYTPNFECTNEQGIIQSSDHLDKLRDLLYESEYDLCEECAGSLAYYILKWKTAKKGVKKEPKPKTKPKTKKPRNWKQVNSVEKHGKIFALRRAGWTWAEVADEFGNEKTAKQLSDSHVHYINAHPELVEQWQGGTRT